MDEILWAIGRGIPVIPVLNTGRAADDFVKAFQGGTLAQIIEQRSAAAPDDWADELEYLEGVDFGNFVHVAEYGRPETLLAGAKRFRLTQLN